MAVRLDENTSMALIAVPLFTGLTIWFIRLLPKHLRKAGMLSDDPERFSTMQRVSTIASTVVNILSFSVGYLLLARCLNCCTTLVWRIAFGLFLLNTGISMLVIAAQPNPYPVLTGGLSVAGAISVWRGREAIRDYAVSRSID
jgi:hypothetical protein